MEYTRESYLNKLYKLKWLLLSSPEALQRKSKYDELHIKWVKTLILSLEDKDERIRAVDLQKANLLWKKYSDKTWDDLEQIKLVMRRGDKIESIKFYRKLFSDKSLRECKLAVEAMMREEGIIG